METLNTGYAVRIAARKEEWRKPTAGLAPGYLQVNVVILPKNGGWADEFAEFCQRNPQPCPLVEHQKNGYVLQCAKDSDIRTDVPKYRVWSDGAWRKEHPLNIVEEWKDDFHVFLLGCSFSFEKALIDKGIPVRHMELGCNVPMFITNRDCVPSGRFRGKLVVSMRPMKKEDAKRAFHITEQLQRAHGPPIHMGDPKEIGIYDIQAPDFGDAVPVGEEEICVFWGCGVTPQMAIEMANPPIALVHSPGHMFLTDIEL